MQRNFQKEFSYLTKTHKRLFKYDFNQYFGYTSDTEFRRIILGTKKINPITESYILQLFQYYFDLQKKMGKAFLVIDVESENFSELNNFNS